PEIEVVRISRDRRRDAYDHLEVAVYAVTAVVALDKCDTLRRWSELIRRRGVAEVAEVVPGEIRVVVVAEVLLNHAPARHQQFEVAGVSPIALNHRGVAVYRVDGLAVRHDRVRTIPRTGPAIEPPEVQIVRTECVNGSHPHDGLEVAVHAVAAEIAL